MAKEISRPGEEKPMTNTEAILEARRKHDAREFHRRVIRRVPTEFGWDTAELECGHSVEMAAFMKESHWPCHKCRDEWIKQQSTQNEKDGNHA